MRAMMIILGAPILLAACGDDSTGADVCTRGRQAFARYYDQGTFTRDTVRLGGVTATGSAPLYVLDHGLGVVGGVSDSLVDGAEWVRFVIDTGAAIAVSYHVVNPVDLDGDGLEGEGTIEAFDVAGSSLGTRPVHGFTIHVGEGLGGVPLSAFIVAARDGDAFRIYDVIYLPCR